MASALVQTKATDSGGYTNNWNFSFDSSVTSGNLIIVWVAHEQDGFVDSMTDNQSNTYTLVRGYSSQDARLELWYAENVTGGTVTITIDIKNATNTSNPEYNYQTVIAREYSGVKTSGSLDTHAFEINAGYPTSVATGNTSTPSQDDNLVICAAGLKGGGGTVFDTSNFSCRDTSFGNEVVSSVTQQSHCVAYDKRITSAAVQDPDIDFTTGLNAVGIVAVFQEAAAGGGGGARKVQTIVT